MRRFIAVTTVITGLFLARPAQAATIELLTNGGFETGTLAGWSVVDLAGGSGTWFATSALATPSSAFATVGPAAGSFYAVTDQGGPGTHALLQSFTVAPGATSVILSFAMFVNDQNGLGPIVNPAGLDHTAVPNQHARVDILSSAATAFDTGAGVLANFYLGIDAGANPHPYTPYLFDITALVAAGGTFQLRFAEVDNQLFFHQGVDSVSILQTVPEPATLLLLGAGLSAVAARRRRR
jgi:hypothetical protein